ncbi:MAG TPA: zinc ribbon domain-containing protein, partial [Chlamydiales bacterium]|nr:zinc ribbon domain-containing protein [Chlamydiales bacterium]
VNPAYTSQKCSQCGHLEEIKLSTRIFKCTRCKHEEDRDVNASKNIMALGLDGLGEIPRSLRL